MTDTRCRHDADVLRRSRLRDTKTVRSLARLSDASCMQVAPFGRMIKIAIRRTKGIQDSISRASFFMAFYIKLFIDCAVLV